MIYLIYTRFLDFEYWGTNVCSPEPASMWNVNFSKKKAIFDFAVCHSS